jgi:hypothetical protein
MGRFGSEWLRDSARLEHVGDLRDEVGVPAQRRVGGQRRLTLPGTSGRACRNSFPISLDPVVTFPGFAPAVPRILTQRYPKAGEANPEVRLGIVDVASGRTAWLDRGAATYEYVLGVRWLPDSRRVAVPVTNRMQTRLDLYFVERADGAATRILTDTDAAWVNQKELQFLGGGKQFLLTRSATDTRISTCTRTTASC